MKLSLLLIPILLLSSCTIDWNGEKDAKIAELEKQIQDDTFKRKVECEKYIGRINDDFLKHYKNTNALGGLEGMYYDKDRKSCVYSAYSINPLNKSEELYLFDILQNQRILTADKSCQDNASCKEVLKEYYEKLRILRGE